jgi:hypothetical protein
MSSYQATILTTDCMSYETTRESAIFVTVTSTDKATNVTAKSATIKTSIKAAIAAALNTSLSTTINVTTTESYLAA